MDAVYGIQHTVKTSERGKAANQVFCWWLEAGEAGPQATVIEDGRRQWAEAKVGSRRKGPRAKGIAKDGRRKGLRAKDIA